MGYQPGPLILQSAGNVGVVKTDYKFADDAHDQLSDLDTLPGSWQPFLDDAAILLSEPSNPFPDVDVDGAQLVLHAYSDPDALLGSSALLTAFADAEEGLGNAIAFSPLESWTPAAAPFVAPAPAEVLGVPVIPPGWLSVAVEGTVPTTPLIPPAGGLAPITLDPGTLTGFIPAPAPVAPPVDGTPIGGLRGR